MQRTLNSLNSSKYISITIDTQRMKVHTINNILQLPVMLNGTKLNKTTVRELVKLKTYLQ